MTKKGYVGDVGRLLAQADDRYAGRGGANFGAASDGADRQEILLRRKEFPLTAHVSCGGGGGGRRRPPRLRPRSTANRPIQRTKLMKTSVLSFFFSLFLSLSRPVVRHLFFFLMNRSNNIFINSIVGPLLSSVAGLRARTGR